MSVKMDVFWDVALCSLVETACHFRGHHQGGLMIEAVRTYETGQFLPDYMVQYRKNSHLHYLNLNKTRGRRSDQKQSIKDVRAIRKKDSSTRFLE
jgi:hypothetical protein